MSKTIVVKQFFRFVVALVLAGFRTCLLAPRLHCLTAPVRIIRSLFTRKGNSLKSGTRLEECRNCPIYSARFETCGNAWRPTLLDGEPAGCFCYMPLKVTLPDATCWLNERTDNIHGWSRFARGV